MAGAATGSGATLGSTLFTAWLATNSSLLTSIGGTSGSREALDTTHLATAAAGTPAYKYGTMIPGDIVRGGVIPCECYFQGLLGPPPIGGASETWTITYANTEASTYAFPGFITDYQIGPAENDSVMRMTFNLQIAGAVTFTA